MNMLQSIIYGLVCGFTEFLPVSSRGHRILLQELFGAHSPEPVREIMIHAAALIALIIFCGTYISKLRRGLRPAPRRDKKRDRLLPNRMVYDVRLIRAAMIPLCLGMLLYGVTGSIFGYLPLTALFFVINGVIVYIPEHLPHGNKDARKLSFFDSLLIGLSSALSVFPGISRVGTGMSVAISRGADQTKALDWILVLSIPALLITLFFDVLSIFYVGFGITGFVSIFGYFLSAISSFLGVFAGISLMRYVTERSSLSYFGFYSWGAGLLTFILFLIT